MTRTPGRPGHAAVCVRAAKRGFGMRVAFLRLDNEVTGLDDVYVYGAGAVALLVEEEEEVTLIGDAVHQP